MGMTSFQAENKTVTVWPGKKSGVPVIYLNTNVEEVQQIRKELDRLHCPDFSLVTICGLDWNRELSPWPAPAIYRKQESFAGEALRYLMYLAENIIPFVESELLGDISWRGVAGYSMAGLFSAWALCQTEIFQRGASVSGSLWFPGIKEYLLTHMPKSSHSCLYFSLGDKEKWTRNLFLQTVEENTQAIEAFYHQEGIQTILQMNPGNHFQNIAARTADGIFWILTQK